jgi:NAD(P)-dependent dehydrogenase (short-subunit alcohol dehydrogenase family)
MAAPQVKTPPAGGLEGLRALVTGGGSGIGLGTARRLVADGAHVTICGRTEEKLQAAVEELSAVPGDGSAAYAVADVTVEEQIAAAVTAATGPDGHLDILFANAGGGHHIGPIAEADAAGVRATVEVNLIGTFLSIKHAVAPMTAAGGGSIIGMSSGAGAFPHRLLWAYGASKAGVDQLCRSAAEELGVYGIRVNTVQPGIIDDELMAFITAGGPLLDDYLAEMPAGRVGTVDDVAAVVRFLAGPESTWITGDCIAVDGGHHLRRGANYELLFGS